MLDTAHVNPTTLLVVDEHGQSASVTSTLLTARKHEVDVRVTVGDETLDTVEQPAAILLAVSSFQHHRLEVRTSIRFCKVH